MRVEFRVGERYSEMSIKELLKQFHVGKGKIEEIRVNNKTLLNNEVVGLETVLKKDDIVSFYNEEKNNFSPSSVSVDVVYEDEHFLIVNKPSGLLIHPDGNFYEDTLVNRVAKYYEEKGYDLEVRYAHRIDYETSGLVIFCKDFLTHARINYEIEQHIVQRKYLALCSGVFNKKIGIINLPIGRDRHISNKFRVSNSEKAKTSITNYEVISYLNGISLVSCLLETGRTHQIRVHLSSIKHPLLGDSLYGGNCKKINRVALHSHSVKINDPYLERVIEVKVDLPEDMKKLLK